MSSPINQKLRRTPLARALTSARLAAGKTQTEAARYLKVGPPMMANAESGVSLLGRDHLVSLAAYYGCESEPLLHAHDISLSVFKIHNRGTSELHGEVGLALSTAWEKLDIATLTAIRELLPKAEWVSSGSSTIKPKAR